MPTARNKAARKTKRKTPAARRGGRKWSAGVTTVSTFPPEGTFTKPAEEVARIMASRRVSPRGIGSGIRMIQFFINRAGRNLSPQRRRELEKAKRILQDRQAKEKTGRKRIAKKK